MLTSNVEFLSIPIFLSFLILICLLSIQAFENFEYLDYLKKIPPIEVKAKLQKLKYNSKSVVKGCDEKLVVNIKMNNQGQTITDEDLIPIDSVYDPDLKRKLKLLNPLIIKLKQEQVLQLYGLSFIRTVTAEAREEIINKNVYNFSGCDTTSSKPTCGRVFVNNKVKPFSEGFCCSCDLLVNVKRQPPTLAKGNKGDSKTEIFGRKKRQITPSGVQYRGGQSCINLTVPEFADPVTYHESAHCLRFSDLKYDIYRLKPPFIDHSVKVQLFKKSYYQSGRTNWREITIKMPVNIGTSVINAHDSHRTLSFTYKLFTESKSVIFSLSSERAIILIPQQLPPEKVNEYPQLKGGPKQYLLVTDDEITFGGDECDKVGVSYEAFARQPERCSHPPGTCLKNQPLHLWQHDMEAKVSNRPGKYFLENYASVPVNPFKSDQLTKKNFLALDYMKTFSSIIEAELHSNLFFTCLTGPFGTITEVYFDSSCPFHTKITVIFTYLGLASSLFHARLADCSSAVPEAWVCKQGPLARIHPQQAHAFKLSLFGELSTKIFHCSFEVLNEKEELVAKRQIMFKKYDICSCMWYCQCSCIGFGNRSFQCKALTLDEFHAAGFRMSLPIDTLKKSCRALVEFLTVILLSFIFFLILGLFKAVLGLCCCSAVGSCGSWVLFRSKSSNLDGYKEHIISDYKVIKDTAGYALNPINRTRNVRILKTGIEFLINLIFFIIVPLAIVIKIIIFCKSSCGAKKPKSDKGSEKDDDETDDNESQETKKEKSIKAKKQKIMGLDDSDSNWSLPSSLELDDDDEDEDTEYVLQEKEASLKNLQEFRTTDSGGEPDTATESLVYHFEHIKMNPSSFIGFGKPQENNLIELQKKVGENLVNTLQDGHTVYRNLKVPIGGVNLPSGFLYSLKGYFTKVSCSAYQFNLSQPTLQYWASDNNSINPPLPLNTGELEVSYPSAEDVLFANELSILPRGLVINVWHSLYDESLKPET